MLRIHFTGDSITDAGRDRTDPASLGDGYVSLLAQAPELADARISNSGIAGNRAIDLVGRWEADVMSSRPDVLSIYLGINDVWRRFDSDDPTTDEEFEAHLRHLLERVPAGVRVLLVEPFLLPVRAEQQKAARGSGSGGSLRRPVGAVAAAPERGSGRGCGRMGPGRRAPVPARLASHRRRLAGRVPPPPGLNSLPVWSRSRSGADAGREPVTLGVLCDGVT
jgi:hypothetical protein